MTIRSAGILLACYTAMSCLSAPTGLKPLPAGGKHILYVGNSLTYTNDLPQTIAFLAASVGDTVHAMTVAAPNLALIDHLNGATPVVQAVQLGGWDFVVLQQGPTPAGICRDSLVLWTQMFDSLVPNTAQLALFMTWPSTTSSTTFDASRVSYEDASIAVSGIFLPAAEAWRAAWEVNPTIGLYGGDGFHPSPIGTYLAALEIYERLSGKDARTFPKQPVVVGGQTYVVHDSIVTQLQNAAHLANERYPSPVTGRAITPKSTGTIPGGRC
jgi:hypothetical protein